MKATDQIIDELLAAYPATDLRARHFYRESLRNLVRLAKSEQLIDMKMDVAKVVSPVSTRTSIYVSPQ